jgi:cytoskeletal protein CcmA (bactofilin family)
MNLSCNLYVDGEFEGIIHSDKEINIGKQGHIKGDVITKRLVVQGYIEGTINAERVEIKANGRVNGTVESAELVIEAKGIFEGSSVVKDVPSVPTSTALETLMPDTAKKVQQKQEV